MVGGLLRRGGTAGPAGAGGHSSAWQLGGPRARQVGRPASAAVGSANGHGRSAVRRAGGGTVMMGGQASSTRGSTPWAIRGVLSRRLATGQSSVEIRRLGGLR